MKTLALTLIVLALQACSVRQYALNTVANAIAQGGDVFSSDDDPELVRAAAPFSLKLIESLLAGVLVPLLLPLRAGAGALLVTFVPWLSTALPRLFS